MPISGFFRRLRALLRMVRSSWGAVSGTSGPCGRTNGSGSMGGRHTGSPTTIFTRTIRPIRAAAGLSVSNTSNLFAMDVQVSCPCHCARRDSHASEIADVDGRIFPIEGLVEGERQDVLGIVEIRSRCGPTSRNRGVLDNGRVPAPPSPGVTSFVLCVHDLFEMLASMPDDAYKLFRASTEPSLHVLCAGGLA